MVGGVLGLSNPLVSFRNFMEDPAGQLTDFAKDKQIQADIAYFEKNIGKVESVDDLFKDSRLSKFILSAFSLEGETNGIGRIKAVLKADYDDKSSLPFVLADKRFSEMAGTLRLDRDGIAAFEDSDLIDSLSQRYIRNEFEVKVGGDDSALREALFFSRSITSATSVYDVLGDNVLRSVVQGALQIPDELAIQPIETQAKAISNRIDVDKLISLSNELGVSKTAVTRAKSDASILETNLAASDQAISQVETLSQQLDLLISAYADLPNVTDPNGQYQDDIILQQTAVPDIIRYEQLLNAADKGLDNVDFYLDSLEGIISAAQTPGADMAALKTSFSSLVSEITTAINEAGAINPVGNFENILSHGAFDSISSQIDNSTTITLNRYDLTDMQSILADADTAFNAATGSGDTNLTTALAKILRSQDRVEEYKGTVAADRTDINEKVANVEAFAATLNTNELILGKESVADAIDRVGTIENLLDQIKALAQESADLLPSDDRSDLDAQFTVLKQELRDTIENTNGIGFDNFLNNIPNQPYEIVSGASIYVTGNIDLTSTIANILDGEDIATKAGAESLANQATLLEIQTDKARNSLERDIIPFESALNKYDPRGVIDNAIFTIQDKISEFIASAGVNGINLLSADQTDIALDLSSSSTNIKLSAFNSFESDFAAGLASAISFLQTDVNQAQKELSNLKDIVDRVKRGLSSDANVGNVELARNSAVIDAAQAQEQSLEENPYQVNDFTLKFIERFLILNGGQGGTTTSNVDSYVTSLFQPLNTSNTQGGDAFANIYNLLV